MSFELSKTETKTIADLSTRLQTARLELDEAISAYNEKLEEIKISVGSFIETYNNILSEAREFTADIASQADSDISDKSEKWHDSKRGQAANEWMQRFQDIQLEDIEIEFPDEIDISEIDDHADELSQLPETIDEW